MKNLNGAAFIAHYDCLRPEFNVIGNDNTLYCIIRCISFNKTYLQWCTCHIWSMISANTLGEPGLTRNYMHETKKKPLKGVHFLRREKGFSYDVKAKTVSISQITLYDWRCHWPCNQYESFRTIIFGRGWWHEDTFKIIQQNVKNFQRNALNLNSNCRLPIKHYFMTYEWDFVAEIGESISIQIWFELFVLRPIYTRSTRQLPWLIPKLHVCTWGNEQPCYCPIIRTSLSSTNITLVAM